VRIALVIGESRYLNLPKLINPESDARSIAETLQKMGYDTRLLLDAPEDGIRKEIRKFASESSKAEVAIVFYAGHGAQLNGNNYLLPIDIDVPRTEADIQFAGLKVDDLINSIGANTKIVFLDACRDNPALFKNLVKGRGSSPAGLAPASASDFNPTKPGSGIFIAYATDAGAVADDGQGQHSPFTQALLRNMQKSISIDDMFSLVTKEVRFVTKNAQRPFKYASLENIVCLTPACSGTPAAAAGDIIQQATQSEDEELQIALQTKNGDALETYLQKYPESKKRSEILSKIAAPKRSELTEWTLYEVAGQRFPQYMQLSSIQHFEDRAAVKAKSLLDPSAPKVFYGKSFPDAAYIEQLNVYDCTKPAMVTSEDSIFDNSGKLLYHYKWGDAEYLNISIGVTLQPGSVGLTAKNIACHAEMATPLISKGQLKEMKFTSLANTPAGDGEIFFGPSQTSQNIQDQKEIVLILQNTADHNVKEFLPTGISIPDPPNFRTEVDHVLLKCNENKFLIDKTEFWNSANELVRVQALDRELPFQFSEFKQLTPYDLLQAIVCGKGYGGIGVLVTPDNGSTKVTEVLSGLPAEKVGIKKDDVITHVNGETLSGLTSEQVIEKLRGPAHSEVDLTIMRKGQDNALAVAVDREVIERHLTQGTLSK
jgi:Caspase domain/PDZ domain